MSWDICKVLSRDGKLQGFGIHCNSTGSLVRPLSDSPTSIFTIRQIAVISEHLRKTYGDPRKGEGTIDDALFTILKKRAAAIRDEDLYDLELDLNELED